MKTSAAGRAAIAQREGCRLTAYRDVAGVWTIGVGHTGRMAPPTVTPGMTIGAGQSDAMLSADLAPVEAAIMRSVVVPLTQSEFDALASLGFNIGVGGLQRSSVVRRLNAGDVHGAADAFLMWAKPKVLAERRAAERAQFLASDATTADVRPARAAVLATKAERTRQGSRTAQSAAAATGTGGTAALAIAHHHHHHLLLVLGLVGLAACMVATIVSLVRRSQAQGLAHRAVVATAETFAIQSSS